MDEVGINFYQPREAGSKAHFFKGKEAMSYGEQPGDDAKAKRILTLMARALRITMTK